MDLPYSPPVISHVGIYVADIERSRAFYDGLLGYAVTDDGSMIVPDSDPPRRQRLVFYSNDPDEHHQFILVEGRPVHDGAFNPINQISFRVRALDDLRRIDARARALRATDVRPVTHGNAWSLYLRDPDGNRLEFYLPTPWYVSQPCREPIDLGLTDAEIHARTEALCRTLPGFTTREAWRAATAERLARRSAG